MRRFTYIILFLFPAFFTESSILSQAWLNTPEYKKASSERDFYMIRSAFEEYWQGKKIEKGKGWKQFKRWENFMEPRVYPEGNLGLPSIYDEIKSLNSRKSLQANWVSLGPEEVPPKAYADRHSGLGRINCIAFHPTNPDILWAGSPSGGFWKTTNGGNSWETTTDNLMSIGISDIAVNPHNPDILYIVTGDGDAGDTYSIGVLKSEDGGITWSQTSLNSELSEREFFRRIIIHPDNPDTMIASSNKGIYKTTDGFISYRKIISGHFKDLEFKPGNPAVVYATSYDPLGDAGFYKSRNTGDSFSKISSVMNADTEINRIAIGVSPAYGSYVYALASSAVDDGFYGLYRSVNNGESWVKVYDRTDLNLLGWDYDGKDDGGQGWYDLTIAVDPENENTLLTGGINIWKSVNRGNSFFISAHWIGFGNVDYVHADHHMLKYNPLNNYLYSCNDGGIYVSQDDGETWRDISDGLEVLQIYRTSASPSVLDLFLTGNQDNGSMLRTAGEWSEVTGGDGMECIIHPLNPDILYTSVYNGSFFKSEDGGNDFSPVGPEEAEGNGAWITPFIMSPNDPDILYMAYTDVYKSEDAGLSWYRISEGLAGNADLRYMAVAPANERYIYVSTFGNIWMTRNGGADWLNIKEGLPNLAITSLEVSPSNPEKVWLTLSGYVDGEKVYYSDDGGISWNNYSEGLPNIPANIIIRERGSPDGLYLGTDINMFYRNSDMNQWEPFKTGLPNVIISDLEIQYNFNQIVASTYGRGLWTSQLFDDSDEIYAELYATSAQGCINEEVVFQINTIDNPDSIVWNIDDQEIFSTENEKNINYSFSEAGIKDIHATVYKNGESYTAELNNYFRVVEELNLTLNVSDTSALEPGDKVYLFASGASSYSWEPSDLVSAPLEGATVAHPSGKTTFTVTGISGNCIAEKSVEINVAPGPAYDSICNAEPLEFGINGPFSNVYATVEEEEPIPDTSNCNSQFAWCNEGGLQNTVWFTFSPDSRNYSFTTQGFDNQMAIYEAAGCEELKNGNYSLIAANDDYFGSARDYAAAIELVNLDPDKKYWIQVDGSAGGETGEFFINISNNQLDVKEKTAASVSVFPNPNKGNFTISVTGLPGNIRLQLFDISGKIVLEDQLNSAGNLNHQIAVKEKGFYILKLVNEDYSFVQRIIVE